MLDNADEVQEGRAGLGELQNRVACCCSSSSRRFDDGTGGVEVICS